jgi:hypothetical protein
LWVLSGSHRVPSGTQYRSLGELLGGWLGRLRDLMADRLSICQLMRRTPFDDLDDSHVLTPKDIAARLRVDPRSVRRAISRGDLTASRTCGIRVLACDAASWWQAMTVEATRGAAADPPPAAAAPSPSATKRRQSKRFARSAERLPLPARAGGS